MTEISPGLNPEEQPPLSEAYQAVSGFISGTVLEQEENSIKTQLGDNPFYIQLGEVDSAIHTTTVQYWDAFHAHMEEAAVGYDNELKRQEKQKAAFPVDVRDTYEQLAYRLRRMEEESKVRLVTSNSPEAEVIKRLMAEAPKLQRPDSEQASFRNYAANTNEAWQFTDAKKTEDYLDNRLFFKTTEVVQSVGSKPKLQIHSDYETIDVPLDLIVSLNGHFSWKGDGSKRINGEYRHQYDRATPSIDTIKHYASLPTELPPVGTINVYVQPDGIMFADNNDGDSHRIVAAVLRGDKTIKANNVVVQCVDRNWLKSQDDIAQAEIKNSPNKISVAGVFEAFRQADGVTMRSIHDRTKEGPTRVSMSSDRILYSEQRGEGRHNLHTLINAGAQFFSVESDESSEGNRLFTLNHLDPTTAEVQLLTVLEPGQYFKVGREDQEEAGYDSMVSRHHFLVGITDDNRISIIDNASKNGTDFLYAPKPEHDSAKTDEAQQGHTPESSQQAYLKRIFAPNLVKEKVLDADYFNRLFGDEPLVGKTEDAAVRPDKEIREVTNETRQDAVAILGQAVRQNRALAEIIDAYSEQKGIKSAVDMVNAIHDDLELRVQIGEMFLQKLDIKSSYLPYGVKRNRQKTPNAPGYARFLPLTSREYVALLALAKIDGTFDTSKEQGDIEYYPNGEVKTGQHRWAADEILFN